MTHQELDLSAFADRVHDRPDVDLVAEMVTFLHQALIDQEVTDHIGGEPHERSLTRTTRRNGTRARRASANTDSCKAATAGVLEHTPSRTATNCPHRILQQQHQVKAIGRAHLELGNEVQVEVSCFVALGVNQKSPTSNLFPNEDQSRDDVSEQRCANTATFVAFVDAESGQQSNWLRTLSGPLR